MYRQVAISTGTKLVFLSGQVARDADRTPVGAGDLAAQVAQAVRNVNTGVVAAGGTFADIAKLTVYVVDWTPDKVRAYGEGLMVAAMDLGIDPTKAVTLIGVAALAEPDLGPQSTSRSRAGLCERALGLSARWWGRPSSSRTGSLGSWPGGLGTLDDG